MPAIPPAPRRLCATLLLLGLGLVACGQPQVESGRTPTVAPAAQARTTAIAATAVRATPTTVTTRTIATPAPSATAATLATPTRTASPTRATASPDPFNSPGGIFSDPTPPATIGPIPGLADALSDVGAITLVDDWVGLSPLAPIVAHVELRPGGAGYTGTAQFSVGGYFATQATPPQAVTCPVAVPPDAIRAFLATLAAVQGAAGAYTPRITHTDDYPKLRIAIATARGDVVFASGSQGSSYAPWGLALPGAQTTYVIPDGTPYRALQALRPYLSYETLDRLKANARGGAATRTTPVSCATPTPAVP